MWVTRLLFAAALLVQLPVAQSEETVVLVVGVDSPIEQLSALDIRKAYLGFAVTHKGQGIKAISMRGDEHLNEIFLQSVVAMSRRTYERRILSLALKSGRPRPREVGGPNELVELIANNPASVGYMWKIDAESDVRVKIIRVLWQGP